MKSILIEIPIIILLFQEDITVYLLDFEIFEEDEILEHPRMEISVTNAVVVMELEILWEPMVVSLLT